MGGRNRTKDGDVPARPVRRVARTDGRRNLKRAGNIFDRRGHAIALNSKVHGFVWNDEPVTCTAASLSGRSAIAR